MPVDVARDEFGTRQAEMTARWYENVKATHGDVEAYIATRHHAYLDRWKEAARFIENGSRVLDIGGGNLYPLLIEFFKERAFRYSYLDVDPSCVDGSRAAAEAQGLPNASFGHGYNDQLAFADSSFEAIFSSHCLEHSINLNRTFSEVNRVLLDGGNLLMAVPFGWESNPEHPYFFGPQEWLSIIADAGFRIRVAQIGCEYPEYGHDYFIAAQKVSAPSKPRLNPDDYTKDSFEFFPYTDGRIRYSGSIIEKLDHVILDGVDWTIEINVPSNSKEILPIFNRHDWSAIIEATWSNKRIVEDLYSWFSYAQPIRIANDDRANEIQIRSVGKNPLSHAQQAVLYGVLVR
ncbi:MULTISPECIES: class I SAM-dependent methyltransferase [Sphingobium]|uniref:class I SAM-dependent methyltransferase n=1 Tax=Sphingobium TaxID=165695 RepID=UPI0015EB8E71|nr:MULTISPECIES: class I SAM-dependent methyltransferase [Sphingobium]MCW2361379.1 SAM-dependent methyltransferase [Sphingobium sp. B10D3B]MCW2401942.1 SAM-dependent methyltransferase [Sphingobium sp. B10D7B]MCW2408921.1 SAM-dependent methyltransferase [Sphingobium xanthum]